jgi:hypothetical protein
MIYKELIICKIGLISQIQPIALSEELKVTNPLIKNAVDSELIQHCSDDIRCYLILYQFENFILNTEFFLQNASVFAKRQKRRYKRHLKRIDRS